MFNIMSYLNNPSHILPKSADHRSEEVLYASLIEIVKLLCPLQWSQVQNSDVSVTKLTGGITNILYLVEYRRSDGSEPSRVIVRVFGAGTAAIIDRDIENRIFAKLSFISSEYPTFFGLFENGRVEGYIQSRQLHPTEMCHPFVAVEVAFSLARFHCRQMNEFLIYEAFIWGKMDVFISIAQDLADRSSNNSRDYNPIAKLNLSDIILEFGNLKGDITSRINVLFSNHPSNVLIESSLLGEQFGYQLAFCHNDLLSGNMLIAPSISESLLIDVMTAYQLSDRGLTIIDYEYANYCYRAFDIANHFCEYAGFDCDFKKNYPNPLSRMFFEYNYMVALKKESANEPAISSQLSSFDSIFQNLSPDPIFSSQQLQTMLSTGDNKLQEFLCGFDRVILKFTLLAHLFWGIWGIVQSDISTIDFDYLKYAEMRFQGYYDHKSYINDSK